MSLTKASRHTRTDPRTVLKHVGTAYRRNGRRYRPAPFDRIARAMTVLTARGPSVVVVRDSRTASLLAEHANAVRRYVDLGDDAPLRQLRRRRIQLDGQQIALATDPRLLDRLAAGGELHYELYRH